MRAPAPSSIAAVPAAVGRKLLRAFATRRPSLAVAALSLGSFGAAHAGDVADAVMRGDRPALNRLIDARADVNAPQPDGATALHWAAYRDDVGAATALIAAGARASVANRDGATPLSLACTSGSVAMIELLLDAGVDPNERLPNGETALMMAARTNSLAISSSSQCAAQCSAVAPSG